ncbi:MAG: 2-hydroxyacyl-CoA dehydratase, partial [Deltaproteobacteria bacterium]|nr:2-hydroxyacyl-CoA dehydratase [Deltaproteobacteria bacterium]
MRISEEFVKINEDPYGYAEKLKQEQKVVGTLCSYVPEEIIIAAGATPFRLFGSVEKTRLADAHLQSYGCSLAKGILEDALSGMLSFLDGVVFTHTCDTMQRLSDIWRINLKALFHLDVILPVKLDTQSARIYYRDVLQTFRDELGERLGMTIADEDLRRAIALSNRIRRVFTRIYDMTASFPGILKGEELYMLERGAMMMD